MKNKLIGITVLLAAFGSAGFAETQINYLLKNQAIHDGQKAAYQAYLDLASEEGGRILKQTEVDSIVNEYLDFTNQTLSQMENSNSNRTQLEAWKNFLTHFQENPASMQAGIMAMLTADEIQRYVNQVSEGAPQGAKSKDLRESIFKFRDHLAENLQKIRLHVLRMAFSTDLDISAQYYPGGKKKFLKEFKRHQ